MAQSIIYNVCKQDYVRSACLIKYMFCSQIMVSLLEMVENIVGKGKNAGYQHFLLFPQCFQNTPSEMSL